MDSFASPTTSRAGSSDRRNQEDPFPMVSESQTPVIDISSSSESEPSKTDSKLSTTSRARAKKQRKAAHQTQPTRPSLRPAGDILSRIRHDPDLGGERQYVVGYLDRHERDPLEMDVTEWKGGVGDVTDEEFIPQHRILYFRKKDDTEGRKVWERATRLDRIFRSGVSHEDDVNELPAQISDHEEGHTKDIAV